MMTAATDPQITSCPDYWTIEEVAAHYRTTVPTLRFWRRNGYGPKGTRVGQRVLYPRAEIERFDLEIARRAANGAGES
jgi:DNA-binding transcriptional MerR regulator